MEWPARLPPLVGGGGVSRWYQSQVLVQFKESSREKFELFRTNCVLDMLKA